TGLTRLAAATLSLHDALPISVAKSGKGESPAPLPVVENEGVIESDSDAAELAAVYGNHVYAEADTAPDDEASAEESSSELEAIYAQALPEAVDNETDHILDVTGFEPDTMAEGV